MPDKPPRLFNICRRTSDLEIDINSNIDDTFEIIAVDRTGIKDTNSGRWIQISGMDDRVDI